MDKKYISDNKRVILITGDENKWFEQAIFIVKKNVLDKGTPKDFVREAELILQNYMTGASPRTPKTPDNGYPMLAEAISESGRKPSQGIDKPFRRKSKLDTAVNAIIIVACVAIMLLVSKSLLG